MQVSFLNENVTQVAIGGGKAAAFSMTDSADFLFMLSDNLYSNKPLAVVREVVCNAWDSHIVSGCTDKPIQITITKDKFIVRDFGKGIPPELITDIYCTYGNSTKTNDGNQTGGFGLGSKAPFAYAEHFQVTNHHKHSKTIYSLSKSSAEVQGKPGIKAVVTIATTESGVEVSIPLKYEDMSTFIQLVKMITANGSMNVELNSQKLPTFAFNTTVNSWLVVSDYQLGRQYNESIFVRYGNVIYPIPNNDVYDDYLTKLRHLMGRFSGQGWQLVLQALPNTIAVTPSRESLSMTDKTTAAIADLLDIFFAKFNIDIKEETLSIVNKSINSLWSNQKLSSIFEHKDRIPGMFHRRDRYESVPDIQITEMSKLIEQITLASYPSFDGFKKTEYNMRLQALLDNNFGDTNLIKSFKREFNSRKAKYKKQQFNGWYKANNSNWLHREVIWPLIRDLTKAELNPKKLLLWYEKHNDNNRWDKPYAYNEAKNYPAQEIEEYLPFLRKIVVLTYRASDAQIRAERFPAMLYMFNSAKDVFYYVVPRNDEKVTKAREFFKAQGYVVLDLTKRQPWEEEEAILPVPKPIVVKKRPTGIFKLSSVMLGSGQITQSDIVLEKAERVENPKFVIRCKQNGEHITLAYLSAKQRVFLNNKIGSLGGLTNSTTQEDKYIKEGALEFNEFLAERLYDEFISNKHIQSSLQYTETHVTNHFNMKGRYIYDWSAFNLVVSDPVLAKQFNIVNELTTEDRMWLSVYCAFIRTFEYQKGKLKVLEPLTDLYTKATVSPERDALIERILSSKLLNVLSIDSIGSLLKDTSTTQEANLLRLKAKKLLLTVLKG